jgi:hypothetical protein
MFPDELPQARHRSNEPAKVPQGAEGDRQDRDTLPGQGLREWSGRRPGEERDHPPPIQMVEQEPEAVLRSGDLFNVVQVEDLNGHDISRQRRGPGRPRIALRSGPS